MIKRLLAAVAASVAFAVPAFGKVDAGTMDLIRTAERHGARFEYNSSVCGGRFNGRYRYHDRLITLCYRGTPTANDYDTVRHEVFHFIQHCRARRMRYNGYLPLAFNDTLRDRWVQQNLTPSAIRSIRATYRPHQHAIELEAFAAANHYNARQMSQLLRTWCRF
jgi:hypothetical protein